MVPFPAGAFRREGRKLFIGKNRFGEDGIRLVVHTSRLKVEGILKFGSLSPLKYLSYHGAVCMDSVPGV